MHMNTKPRYSIKTYMTILVISSSMGMIISAILLHQLGKVVAFGSHGVLVMILIAQSVCIFSVLHGFYKDLVKNYGLHDLKIILGN